MSEKGTTYAEAGVDIKGEGAAIRGLLSSMDFKRTGPGSQVDLGGHFTGLIELGDHYLSMCTDGVGSKLLIAEAIHKWDTVGIDCMAMNVNDLICIGAEPLAFVDYIASESPDPMILGELGKGLNEGARQSNVSIIGGETATLPEIVKGQDLAGTCLGYVRKDELITGERISPGDLMLGIPSSGFHSNGFSLVRRVVQDNGISYASPLEEIIESRQWRSKTSSPETKQMVEEWASERPASVFGELLLTPTRIYVKEVLEVLRGSPAGSVKGMANITGGGLRNLCRMKDDVRYDLDDPLPVPEIISMVQTLGRIDDLEMYQTFNMGMGYTMVVDPELIDGVMDIAKGFGIRKVGQVVEGKGVGIKGTNIEYDGYV